MNGPDHEQQTDSARTPTFDEELLLWLEGESPEVRAADAGRVHDIAAEFARGFQALAGVGRAVTVFGSARTPPGHPHYEFLHAQGDVRALRQRLRYLPRRLRDTG
jgi:hypothetical protein